MDKLDLCETCRRTELERANKALILNGIVSSSYNPRLLAASAKKPTLWIKKLNFAGHSPYNIKLRTASSYYMPCQEQLMKERENAEKALSLNYGF